MGFFKNLPISLKIKEYATFDQFARAVESNLGQSIESKSKDLTLGMILDTLTFIYTPVDSGSVEPQTTTIDLGSFYPITGVSNFAILNDVFTKLKSNAYSSDSFKDETLIQGAIKGMADATGDKHTAYFPPVESKNFQESLGGEFEGIGAYVDMPKPGELHIVAPISGTPSEKAGLMGGDIVTKIDNTEITDKVTLDMAVGLIKGPVGKRAGQELDFSIMRAKITVNYVEQKKLDTGEQYVKITTFGA